MENLFKYQIASEHIHFKYIKGNPAIIGQEFHDYNEFILFMDGSSRLISKDIQQPLKKGSLILIPKGHFHQFDITSPLKYTRCIFGFREIPEMNSLICEVFNTVKVITNPDQKILTAFEDMIAITKSNLRDAEKKLFLNAVLVQLIIHFKHDAVEAISENINISPVVREALRIIDGNFTKPLSVTSVAKLLYVSPSTIAHKFSEELQISVYQYIIKKRMALARQYIESGEPLTSAATKSGFSDYSCFYRLYKKYYKNNF